MGEDGKAFPHLFRRGLPLIPIPIQEEMATHSHTYLGRNCHSLPYLCRGRWPLIHISIQEEMATHFHTYLGRNGQSLPYLSRIQDEMRCIPIFIQEEMVIYMATHLNGIWEQMATNFNTCPIGDGHWILEGENLRQYSHRSNDNPFQFVSRRGRPLNIYMGGDAHSLPYLHGKG